MSEPLTITAAAPLIRTGELTPSELLEQCLRRIDVYEPAVQAWVYLDRERARSEAEQLTAERKRGHVRGPLHGIPVGIKDIIDVFDMPTGCGSKQWANSYARRDATCVERLRQAGAVILGKTVTTPYAFTDPPVTRNPWNLSRTPGGSSSGSAAAVACGMCLVALGTQTGGSLTRPASYCGVCSLKPTYGRVSVDGVLPLAPSLDHVGVMANCVRDLAVMFEAISDAALRNLTEYSGVPDCVSAIDRPRGNIPYVGQLRGYFEDSLTAELRDPYTTASFRINEHLQYLKQDAVTPAGFRELPAAHRTVMSAEAAEYHCARMKRWPDDYPPQITRLITDGERASAKELIHAEQLRSSLVEQLRDALKGRIYFTSATVDFPPPITTTGDPRMNSPWSFVRFPTVSLPVGWSVDGLPHSIQMIGQENYEEVLLAVAAFVEERLDLPRRLPPVPA